jgi:hypothetical protein
MILAFGLRATSSSEPPAFPETEELLDAIPLQLILIIDTTTEQKTESSKENEKQYNAENE